MKYELTAMMFYEDFVKSLPHNDRDEFTYINCMDIEGTNGYCDDLAACKIRECIKNISEKGIHFLGSGNYHYLSLFWLEKIKEEFALIVFDNHTDMQEAAFGNILSCGSWIKEALDENKYLKEVYLLGVNETLVRKLPNDIKRATVINDGEFPETKLPVYISIDKDVLSEDYAACDWDQGNMSLEKLEKYISFIGNKSKIIGMDICGDKKTNPSHQDIMKNLRTNEQILSLIRNFCD